MLGHSELAISRMNFGTEEHPRHYSQPHINRLKKEDAYASTSILIRVTSDSVRDSEGRKVTAGEYHCVLLGDRHIGLMNGKLHVVKPERLVANHEVVSLFVEEPIHEYEG